MTAQATQLEKKATSNQDNATQFANLGKFAQMPQVKITEDRATGKLIMEGLDGQTVSVKMPKGA